MFSYLRPHRRTPSTPTSPNPDPLSPSDRPPLPDFDTSRPSSRSQDGYTYAQNARYQKGYSLPPSLPPIPRVASVSTGHDTPTRSVEGETSTQGGVVPREPQQGLGLQLSGEKTFDGFKKWEAPERRPDSAGKADGSRLSRPQTMRPTTGTGLDGSSASKHMSASPNLSSFAVAPDPKSKPMATGRRPTGARMSTPPSGPPTVFSNFEPPQQKSSKTKLNMLNPMSLLARRRTSQIVPQTAPIPSPKETNASQNYDPRIRGTVVHDFSAPRPQRNLSYHEGLSPNVNVAGGRQWAAYPSPHFAEESNPWSGGTHTPLFTEDFEEEQFPAAGPHVRKAADLSDLDPPHLPFAKGKQKQPELPEPSASETEATQVLNSGPPVPERAPPAPPKSDIETSKVDMTPPTRKSISIDASQTPPKSSPSKKKARSRNVSEVSARDIAALGLPRHMKSTSSRFSFDMIGAASQEKILEDRHRQKELEKQSASPGGADDEYDNEGEDFDFENMMDDDGIEEKIPGVNADASEDDDYDGFDEPPVNNGKGFIFYQHPQSNLSSPITPYSLPVTSTPRDGNGNVIEFPTSKESPQPDAKVSSEMGGFMDGSKSGGEIPETTGSVAHDEPYPQGQQDNQDLIRRPTESSPRKPVALYQTQSAEEDDLYFDDGIIDLPDDDGSGAPFDESIFDRVDTDEYGRPLQPFIHPSFNSHLPTIYSPPAGDDQPKQLNPEDLSAALANISVDQPGETALSSKETEKKLSGVDDLVAKLSISEHPPPSGSRQPDPQPTKTPDLTQSTLEAYQSALAQAAFDAAASGKFRRHSESSPPNPSSALSENDGIQPGLVADSGHQSSEFSRFEPFSPTYPIDDFDYDDALSDDPIIAEANAEALANDREGFYGQEFGFYSAPSSASSEAIYANGGYFGPFDSDGLGHSRSGRREIMREPNLTPITERSEYSNRNSVMSNQIFGSAGQNSVLSPGLAQLQMLEAEGAGFADDMSLSTLLKLRRGAWGGSQASLHSSKEEVSPDPGSPMGQMPPPWSQFGHARKNSAFSLTSDFVLEEGLPPSVLGNAASEREGSESPKASMPLSGLGLSFGGGNGVNGVTQGLGNTYSPLTFMPPSDPGVMCLPDSVLPPLPEQREPSLELSREEPSVSNHSSKTKQEHPADGANIMTTTTSPNRDKQSSHAITPVIAERKHGKHHHTNSSDSVSYVKENLDDGRERWVLERRRTAEDGGVEILGREVICGGRI